MTFASIHHPGDASRALVAARAQSLPVALVFLVLMVVSLAAVLQGVEVLRPLLIAVPVGYLVAASIGLYGAQKRYAEVVTDGGRAAIRSVWEASGGGPAVLVRVHSVLPRREGLLVGLGDEVVTLRPEDWPAFDRVHRALADAARISEIEGQSVSWT
ncbi:MAG: hypothetical protein AAFQ43_02420 [Bacteroidota bacterium]